MEVWGGLGCFGVVWGVSMDPFTDTTCVSPSPAGPAGCFPLNFLNLINLKFRVRAPNGCCIL